MRQVSESVAHLKNTFTRFKSIHLPAGVEDTPAEVASGGPARLACARVKHPETEAFMALLFHNWSDIANEHNTGNRKKIFTEVEKLLIEKFMCTFCSLVSETS